MSNAEYKQWMRDNIPRLADRDSESATLTPRGWEESTSSRRNCSALIARPTSTAKQSPLANG